MHILILGFGNMGKLIKTVAQKRGHKTTTLDPMVPEADIKELNNQILASVDICIDYSFSTAFIKNFEIISKYKKNIVIGTTGWYEELPKVKKMALENNIGLVYGSNFSIGVQVFFKIVKEASNYINNFEQYDVALREMHHRGKADSPSGTALSLSKIIANAASMGNLE